MEKAKILKGLECCAGKEKNCDGCPYNPVGACTTTLAKDAADLLKANEIPKPKYPCAIIFTKRTNLSAYCNNKVYEKCGSDTQFEAMRKYYAREREVHLILLTRYESGKLMCKIKCPINPLPVKGEFEVPSYIVVDRYLRNNGWQFKQKVYSSMLE